MDAFINAFKVLAAITCIVWVVEEFRLGSRKGKP